MGTVLRMLKMLLDAVEGVGADADAAAGVDVAGALLDGLVMMLLTDA